MTTDLVAEAAKARQEVYGDLAGVSRTADSTETRISPVTMYVRKLSKQMGETFYTAKEVAEMVGVSVQAIRKYGKNEVCGKGVAPSRMAKQGKMTVYLYTEEDVEAIRHYLGGRSTVTRIGN